MYLIPLVHAFRTFFSVREERYNTHRIILALVLNTFLRSKSKVSLKTIIYDFYNELRARKRKCRLQLERT